MQEHLYQHKSHRARNGPLTQGSSSLKRVSREDKEAHFEMAVQLLAPIARQVLTEVNTSLLNTGATH
jgi:hypothetical protein